MPCVAFCGLLGGSIRMLLRFRDEFATEGGDVRELPWYFLTPPIGGVLAVGFYLVVRGGFLASVITVTDVNVFAFGGIGVLVGLFAESATARLQSSLGAALGGSGDDQAAAKS